MHKSIVKEESKPIYTLDIETDPFRAGRKPLPFCIGLWDGKTFTVFWGARCIAKMRTHIEGLIPGVIYMHNGGRFDLFYLLKWLEDDAIIINRRIVLGRMVCDLGVHEIRDSYAIMPFPLSAYKKDDIDYRKMEKEVREQNKAEILEYLKNDCVYLHELCTGFVSRFGFKLTVGGAAMHELQKIHDFDTLTERQDKVMRGTLSTWKPITADLRGLPMSQRSGSKKDATEVGFYYGGRVQYFRNGIIEGNWKVYDVNSMYPFVMSEYEHPLCRPTEVTKRVGRDTCFVLAEGKNFGAFPTRSKNGIRFDIEHGIFGVSIHEWRAALSLDLFEPSRIIRCINFKHRGSFKTFVDKFYNARQECKKSGDDIGALHFKYLLNSCSGKFAQNPANYAEHKITSNSEDLSAQGWEADTVNTDHDVTIWSRPVDRFIRYNCATAASITGAARSILMRAIARAKNPVYCDTDSIVCEELPEGNGVVLDDKKLGAWKLETAGHRIAIGGKKLYALFSNACPTCGALYDSTLGDCFPSRNSVIENCTDEWHEHGSVKQANKGCKATPAEIVEAASGGYFEYENIAPTFKWDGTHTFISRIVQDSTQEKLRWKRVNGQIVRTGV